jgi:hypothetical protein
LDFNNGQKITGEFGINIHRAMVHGDTLKVDNWSAGCQVFENGEAFQRFLQLCEKHRSIYGNQFTYTLIDFRAIQRETRRRITLGAAATGLSILLFAAVNYNKFFKPNFTKNKNEQHE